MTTLLLKNNSKTEVSFDIFTQYRADPFYTNTILPGSSLSLEFPNDFIREILTREGYKLTQQSFNDPDSYFPDNNIFMYKYENYNPPKGMSIRKPDNTLIGIEMRDGD